MIQYDSFTNPEWADFLFKWYPTSVIRRWFELCALANTFIKFVTRGLLVWRCLDISSIEHVSFWMERLSPWFELPSRIM